LRVIDAAVPPVRIALIFSNSDGLAVDARVIEQALAHHAKVMNVDLDVQQIKLPWQYYYRTDPVRFDRLKLRGRPDAIVFIENIVEFDPPIDARIPTVLVPNPEWTNARTERLLKTVSQVWHKSRFSRDRLTVRMAGAAHHYTGFTSLDPSITVRNYGSFAHFRGKATTRHSEEVLAVWQNNPQFPQLNYQFYQEQADSFEFAGWLSCNNVAIRAGRMPSDAYFQALGANGIHLCTSGAEGFGHYINEARAMSAVAIVLDAPPMNELIDRDCGVLLTPCAERPLKLGVRYQLSEAELERGIGAVLTLAADDLETMGRNARRRFLSERDAFVERLGPAFEILVQLAS
jgi:hypothetical protein